MRKYARHYQNLKFIFALLLACGVLSNALDFPSLYVDPVNRVEELCAEENGTVIECTKHGSLGVQEISMRSVGHDDRYRVLLICGQHAREMVSTELCISFAKNRCRRIIEDLAELGIGIHVTLIPLMNVSGRRIIERCLRDDEQCGRDELMTFHGSRDPFCVRKNAKGVDLNRNFLLSSNANSIHTQTQEALSSEIYPGERYMTEEEVNVVSDILLGNEKSERPSIVFNVHSGSSGDILLPYDRDALRRPRNYVHMLSAATRARRQFCPKCRVAKGSSVLYESEGTLTDYAVDALNIAESVKRERRSGESYRRKNIYAYTLEIYANTTSGCLSLQRDSEARAMSGTMNSNTSFCYCFFNPQSIGELSLVIDKWSNTIEQMIYEIISIEEAREERYLVEN